MITLHFCVSMNYISGSVQKSPATTQPPGYSCKPILMIGLPSHSDWEENLSEILVHCLLYSTTSTYMDGSNDYGAKMKRLMSLGSKELIKLSHKHKASVVWSEEDILNQQAMEVDMVRLRELEKGDYQAIIVDDTCFMREPDITRFVSGQYQKGVSVVIVAIEGFYDLSPLRNCFDVDWNLSAYERNTVRLNKLGKKIIGREAFPEVSVYTKSHFVVGEGELFHTNHRKGSPVVTVVRGSKSVSYFGFVNWRDVAYGGILLKLCFAGRY
mmetsp:Transcript_7997/g.16188  ORF Transcript_7997/g.16188 Transcript_7997/m.16188 type:complete len:269 (+) Transcript_7997:796-1602(+)